MLNDPWTGIYGHEQEKSDLLKIFTGERVPQSIILSGPKGCGKDIIASRLIKILNLRHMNTTDPVKFITRSHFHEPMIKYITPLPVAKNESADDNPFAKYSENEFNAIMNEYQLKENNPYHLISVPRAFDIKISSIRDLYNYFGLAVTEFPYKGVIISEANKMNLPAQNALLKNLEEPPEGYIFFLTTDKPGYLSQTIASRCWHFNLNPLSPENLRDILINYYETDPAGAENVAAIAEGDLPFALELIDNDVAAFRKKIIDFLRFALAKRFHSAAALFAEEFDDEKEPVMIPLIIRMVLKWIKEYYNYINGKEPVFFKEYSDTFSKFHAKYPDASFHRISGNLENALYRYYENNVNINIIFMKIMFELASVTDSSLQTTEYNIL